MLNMSLVLKLGMGTFTSKHPGLEISKLNLIYVCFKFMILLFFYAYRLNIKSCDNYSQYEYPKLHTD